MITRKLSALEYAQAGGTLLLVLGIFLTLPLGPALIVVGAGCAGLATWIETRSPAATPAPAPASSTDGD